MVNWREVGKLVLWIGLWVLVIRTADRLGAVGRAAVSGIPD